MYYLCQSFTCCAKTFVFVINLQCACLLWYNICIVSSLSTSVWFLENCANLISCMTVDLFFLFVKHLTLEALHLNLYGNHRFLSCTIISLP